jgi:hypothetical protein
VSACLGILLLVSFVCLAMRKTKKKGNDASENFFKKLIP